MSHAPTTTMSAKGQVVIPAEIRSRLGLEPGTKFVAVAEGDVVVFKVLAPPAVTEFDGLLARARSAAAQVGLEEPDAAKAVAKVRASE